MQFSLTGFLFLLGYIVLVGVASFLQKFSMKELTPYQINSLMAIGMAVTAVAALWLKQGSLVVPVKSLPLGGPIGLLMALGSTSYVLALSKLPVGTAAAISTSHVVQPVDECEERCLKEMRSKLAELGVRVGEWRPAKSQAQRTSNQ